MYRVIWSPRALQNYNNILDDLANFSVDAALKLDEKVDKLMKQLSSFPFMCPPSTSKDGYRRCVVSKNYSFVYRVRKDAAYITSIDYNKKE